MRKILLLLALILLGFGPAPDAVHAQEATDAQTEDDKGFITRFLEEKLSGAGRSVIITGFAGALSSRATYDQITIADDEGIWLTLNNGAIQWNRSQLLRGRVDIVELSAAEIFLPRMPAAEEGAKAEAPEFALPELPVSVRIEKILADHVELGEPVIGLASVLKVSGSMELAGGEGLANLKIDRLDGPRGEFQLAASYANETKDLSLDLSLDEDADGLLVNLVDLYGRPSVKADISGKGPLSDFTAEISLATDGKPRVTGRASAKAEADESGAPGTGFRLELGGDVASLLAPDNRAFFGAETQLLAQGWRGDDGRMELPVLMIDTQGMNVSGALTTTDTGAPQSAVLLMTLGADAGAAELPVTLPFGGGVKVNDGRLDLQYDAAKGDGWTLSGRIGALEKGGTKIGALDLNGKGTVTLEGDKLAAIDGELTFGGNQIEFDDAALAQAVGDEILGRTNFLLTKGEDLKLSGMMIDGGDYGLTGDVMLKGLSTGITANLDMSAGYADLSRLSQLAGRPLTGSAMVDIKGDYVVLTRGFDVNLQVEGNDISLDQEQLDALLTGVSRINLQARRDSAGIRVQEFKVNAQRLTATAEGYLNSSSSDLKAKISMPALSEADAKLGGSIEAEANVTGPSGARRLTVTADAQDLKIGVAELDGALRGQTKLFLAATERDKGYVIEQFDLNNPQIKASGEGNLVPGQMNAEASVNLTNLTALGRGWAGSLRADATIREEDGVRFMDVAGRGNDLALGQQNIDGALTGITDLTLKLEQQGEVFTIRDAKLSNEQLNGSAAGIYGPGQSDLSANLSIRSLAALGQGWSGSLKAQGRMQDQADGSRKLDVTGTGQDLSLGQGGVDNALTGETRLALRGTEKGGVLTIEGAHILNDQAEVTASGVVGGDQTNVSGRIDLPRLAALGAGLSGSLVADGSAVAGSDGVINVQLAGTGRDLAMGQQDLDNTLAGPTDIKLTGALANGVFTINDAQIDNANLYASANGKVGAGATDLSAKLAAGDLRFLGRGISGGVNIDARVVDQGGTRRITANGSANGLAIGQQRVDPLLAGRTTLDVAMSQSAGNMTIDRLAVQNPQMNLSANGALGSSINLNLTVNNLALVQPGFAGPATVSGSISQPRAGGNYLVDLAATAPGGTRSQISGSLAGNFSTTDLRISGVSDAALANPLIRTRSVEGPISFDINLNGPPELNSVSGNVTLQGVRLAEPKLGLTLNPINLTARLQNGLINLDGQGGVEAGGVITVSGPIDLRSRTVDVDVGLEGVILRDPNLYETQVWGNVLITGALADAPLISGRIDVWETELRIPSTGLGGATAIPPGIEHIGDTRPVRATRGRAGIEAFDSLASREAGLQGPAATPPAVPPRLDLVLNAPRQIFIRGRGVDAEMGGQIRLTGTTRKVMPIGTLELIRGRVDLLGKRFTLTEGLVEMQGNLVPVLRLVAQTSQDGITTRIIIDGEARDPDIKFESSPAMPEEEVLSQLLFGRGLDNISALQAAQLANAVAVLAGRGGVGVIGNLRSKFGLDDLDLQTDDDGNVQVRAGKYISDNVYTDVAVGDDGKAEVNLNLDISETIRARAAIGSDGESTIGVYYEKDY